MYVSDEAWQYTVNALFARAALVVMRAGATEGLRWEIQQVIRMVRAKRFVLLLPFSGRAYNEFRSAVDGLFPKGLVVVDDAAFEGASPSQLTVAGLIYFDSNWTPRVVALRQRDLFHDHPAAYYLSMPDNASVEAHLRALFRPVVERLGMAWRDPFLFRGIVFG
jgi:hypothetical protein